MSGAPIRGPVRRDPLGLIDGRSIAPVDLVTTRLLYPDREGSLHAAFADPTSPADAPQRESIEVPHIRLHRLTAGCGWCGPAPIVVG